MAPLRCCSYNCRGWNTGVIFLKNILNSIDVCFLQEHWLIPEQFNQIDAINDDFLSVNVCGMDNFSLLAGRPFGGCSILYRKTLSLTVSPLSLSSNRLYAIRINTHSGKSYLFLNVYMPYEGNVSSFSDYLNTLGEIQGVIDANPHSEILLSVILM